VAIIDHNPPVSSHISNVSKADQQQKTGSITQNPVRFHAKTQDVRMQLSPHTGNYPRFSTKIRVRHKQTAHHQQRKHQPKPEICIALTSFKSESYRKSTSESMSGFSTVKINRASK